MAQADDGPDLSQLLPEERAIYEATQTEKKKGNPPAAKRGKGPTVLPSLTNGGDTTPGAWIKVDRLPSQYLPYRMGIEVSYRPYTYEEIDSISTDDDNVSKMGFVDRFMFMMEGIRVRNMDKMQLALVDVLYLLLLRKISSLGSEKFVGHYYYKGTRYTQVYSMDDLGFDVLDVPALPVIADISGQEMHFSPLTLERYLQLALLGKHEHERSLVTAMCCNMPFEEAESIVNNSVGVDIALLEQINLMLDMGVEALPIYIPDPSLEGGVFTGSIDVTDINALVAPFREQTESGRNPIRFGL